MERYVVIFTFLEYDKLMGCNILPKAFKTLEDAIVATLDFLDNIGAFCVEDYTSDLYCHWELEERPDDKTMKDFVKVFSFERENICPSPGGYGYAYIQKVEVVEDE